MDQLRPSEANSSPLTPIGFLERAATIYGGYPSIIYGSTTYTWSTTHRRCLRVASSLSSLGIGRGHVVSVVAHNIPAMYELQFAVPMAGAVLNSINTRLDARTASVHFRHSETKLIFVDHQLASLVIEALSLLPSTTPRPILVLIEEEDDVDVSSPSTVDFHFHYTYERLVMDGDPEFEWVRPRSDWEPMTLNYTSGTTSSPKGVVHCHRGAFLASLGGLIDWSVPKQPVFLWTLPMFHGNGWGFAWGIAALGGTNICIRKVDVAVIYGLIERHGVTHMCGAPVVLNLLSNPPIPNKNPLQKPVHILTAGAPPPAAVLLRMESLGFAVTHGYGSTETGGTVVSCAWKPHWDRFPATERARLKARQGVRTVGMTDVDVVDPESGLSVKRGEVVVKGGCLMLGYLKDPEATAGCMRDGWFYTGDVAVMHPDRYLEIKDRSKDVIISGGENLSSVEVESVLFTNPAVNEAAVVARPDSFWGETPCAFLSVNVKTPKPTSEEIIDYCRGRMPRFMVPKTVVFLDELPKIQQERFKSFCSEKLPIECNLKSEKF